MVYRETDDEFDDGGTPMWRARQARVIDVMPAKTTLRYRLRRLTLIQIVMLAVFFGLILPWIILFGGVALMTFFGINPG